MRRLTVTLVCILCSTIVFAEEITGVWTRSSEESDSGLRMSSCETLAIHDGGRIDVTAAVGIYYESEGKEAVVLKLFISCNGKWQYANPNLTITLDPESLNTEVKEKIEKLPNMIVNMLKKKITSEFRKEMRHPSQYTVTTLSDSTLSMRDTADKEAEEETYIRKEPTP